MSLTIAEIAFVMGLTTLGEGVVRTKHPIPVGLLFALVGGGVLYL